jgi:hypothetical protein
MAKIMNGVTVTASATQLVADEYYATNLLDYCIEMRGKLCSLCSLFSVMMRVIARAE